MEEEGVPTAPVSDGETEKVATVRRQKEESFQETVVTTVRTVTTVTAVDATTGKMDPEDEEEVGSDKMLEGEKEEKILEEEDEAEMEGGEEDGEEEESKRKKLMVSWESEVRTLQGETFKIQHKKPQIKYSAPPKMIR